MRVMTDGSSNPMSLVKASKDDIPSLIRIHLAAFTQDNATRLMYTTDADMKKKLQNILNPAFSDPKKSTFKAINKETGDILGWIGFVHVGYSDAEVKEEAEPAEKDKDAGTRLSKIGELIKNHSARVRDEWMSNKKYIHVGTLVTDPAHQGHGVGSALTHLATSEADTDGVPCWIESTAVAHGVYYRLGFKDVGGLEIDLREYAPGGKSGKRRWGLWETVYMLRLPETK